MPTLLIADDHSEVLQRLVSLLEMCFQVVGTVS